MDTNPNVKGNVAELKIAARAAELGLEVYGPLTEHGRTDLVLNLGGSLRKIQCKWGRLNPARDVVMVQLSGSRLTPAGYIRKTYSSAEIDFVGVYCGDLNRCYLLPASLFDGKSCVQLRLKPARNGQRACVNLAEDYEFAGAVAQLEERRHGMAEARGSSPLSSTFPPPGPESRPLDSIGSNEFRNKLGYYLELAARGHELLVTRRGRPFVKVALA